MASDMPVRGTFVKTFVNEMYAILLGIGVAEVIFSDEFREAIVGLPRSPSLLALPLTCLFAVGIVLKYWASWAEDVEYDVGMSKREFVIDFCILLNLELFFVFAQQPLVFGMLLMSLAVLDLVWVINHLHDIQAAVAMPNVRPSRWILEKAVAVAIFGAAAGTLAAVRDWGAVSALTRSAWHPAFEIGVLIGVFALVQTVCFNEVRRSGALVFRGARPDDADGIAEIHNENVLVPEAAAEKSGFLLEPVRADDVRRRIENGFAEYFVVTEADGEVAGYAELAPRIPPELLPHMTWTDPAHEEAVQGNGIRLIECVAVRRRMAGRRLGQYLYGKLFERYPNSAFCAFVARHPFSNQRSLRFHRKAGFVCAAHFESDKYKGYDDYRSDLLVKSA